jgi:Tol biopolymer transport system component
MVYAGTLGAQSRPAPGTPDPELANEHFGHGNYIMALPLYVALVKKEGNNLEYNMRAGLCYLRTNGHKKEAVRYFEVATKNPKCENEAWLYLGQAYQYALRFDDAIKAFETYKLKADKDGKANADHYIAQCKSGKILVANPLDVNFQNLGKEVNSEFPDYYPFVTQDESMLVFTSRRKGNVGATSVEMDGYYASDIYVAKSQNGVFQKAKGVGPGVNGNYDEQCTSLSPDGKQMVVYVDNITSAGDLFVSPYKTSFGKMEKIDADPQNSNNSINSDFETAGAFSPDGSVFYFASKRNGGQGGTDIYMARKLPGNFGWGMPVPVPGINTPYNEDFPFMAPDGKTLYFSSQGLNSMGGYDLFYTTFDQENNTWSAPRNIGFPVNSPEDDYTISYTENNRVAYITSDREGGIGDMDIWRVVFNEVQQNSFTVLTGTVLLPDSTMSREDLTIMVASDATKEDIGSYRVSPKSGHYVIALPPGKYILSMDVPGCKPYVETVIIFDIGPQGEMSKDIRIMK